MKCTLILFLALVTGIQPAIASGNETVGSGTEARVYLRDGTVVQGQLLDRADDLIIIRVDNEVFTFEPKQVKNIVTLNSLGGEARTVTELEFPYIGFLGATAALGLISWIQFDRADDKRREADLNEESGLPARAAKLDDDADRAELLGWGSAILAVGSLGIALIPRRTERRVFPALGFSNSGTPSLQLTCRF